MPAYTCNNCINLKTKLITKKDISNINKKTVQGAIKKHDIEFLGLMFPFNLTAYKRITKYGECKAIYCSEHILQRDLYIHKDNSNIIPEVKPCPKYK
ncbi:MAG TPA: hypothetical protein DCY56_04315 [Candidatus Omnitrophica bacterium]|nr:hypothetical protein [Candidatus Omnitrophota bacterium]